MNMSIDNKLQIGDVSDNGQVTIIDQDRLCFLVKSESRGAQGIRTISKALLNEYVDYLSENPNVSPNDIREALCGKSTIDKFEYGYSSTLTTMAKMALCKQNEQNINKELLRQKTAASFLRQAINITINQDNNLSKLEALNKYETSSKQLLINGFKIGRDKNQLPNRIKDVDVNINWRYNNVDYVLYMEFIPLDLENNFFPVYNEAYKGVFHMYKDSDGYYILEDTSSISRTSKDIYQEPYKINNNNINVIVDNIYRPYITAIKSKPFLLLAGISGTGKSRIVRELARACWDEGSEEYEAQKPENFEMVQVKPNWHDSSELIGYVSRVSGSPVFEAGDFLKFVAKAWENPEVPYFLCLDEMNLAPVEQYFAEYLSVVESRKADGNGVITTDPILKKCDEQWYFDLTAKLTNDDEIRARFNKDGICIPQNLIVVGTVNMDETTFSFSRKVLDRAMTIEMNEVDLYGGLTDGHEKIGKLEAGNLIGTAVEGVDVYKNNKDVCEKVINYLKVINANLEGTPFKVAYRTRNEFLLYVVNNLPYNKEEDGSEIAQSEIIARALDEITSMKILSRIEGDETKIGNLLEQQREIISGQLKTISDIEYSATKNEEGKAYSISLAKLKEMEKRLKSSGYTSFWS